MACKSNNTIKRILQSLLHKFVSTLDKITLLIAYYYFYCVYLYLKYLKTISTIEMMPKLWSMLLLVNF